ncbi:MAG: hypothetical protein WAK94_07625, partial [Steroidobacteraceae bacterium]
MTINARAAHPLLGWLLTMAAVIPAAPAARAADPGGGAPFTAEDLVLLNRVSDPQLSPDGRWVAYVERETDLQANKGRNGLWLIDLAHGGVPQRLAEAKNGDTSPRWAPDSRTLYFLSNRSGSAQVWRVTVPDGTAQRVSDYPLDVGSLKVSPRGDRL